MGKSRSQPQSMSKSDLKFEKKHQFYGKVRETVAVLSAQKAIGKKKKLRRGRKKKLQRGQKKLKTYDLSSLSEFLPELKAPQQPTPETEFNLNCKSRQKLILKEGKQLSAVLNHPAFQSDPLAAIYQHLQSTQPVTDEKPKKNKNKNGGKKRKEKKKSKVSDGPQSMVM